MSRLCIGGNNIILTPLPYILEEVRRNNPNYLKQIKVNSKEINITCPFHKDGQENHPSCFVHNDIDSETYGVYHCFTCGKSGTFLSLISHCLEVNEFEASEWLIAKFTSGILVQDELLPEIELDKKIKRNVLDESILDEYKYIHPYVLSRGIPESIIKKFSIGWDKDDDSITFPCWDEHNNLVGIFKRKVKEKKFYIPPGIEKPIYLLNFVIKENHKIVYVVESTFNALSLWSWGYPAICLFGTGSKEQYEVLKKSGIRNYVLCFDGDNAGVSGRNRFMKNMDQNCFISYKILPVGKDVNDLTKEEFDKLEIIS